jgi:phosphoribosylformimino-5-aminoimidazole carboxamide ribotide isomerase
VFEVLPAIDVRGGRLAGLEPGGGSDVRAFGGDPLAAARAFAGAGAGWLHVVDVDLAVDGRARNLDVLSGIAALGPRVQASGGVRDEDGVRALLDAGAARVVMGSAALSEPERVTDLLARHGERLVVGIEVDQGRIRSRGRDPVDLGLMETLGWLAAAGASLLLVTAVDRVSGLAGADVALVRRVARAGRPVLAAGGISRIEDLRALRAAGAAGAVVGRAALEGRIDLSAAFAGRF